MILCNSSVEPPTRKKLKSQFITADTFVGFFVCGMMGRFGCEKDITTCPSKTFQMSWDENKKRR